MDQEGVCNTYDYMDKYENPEYGWKVGHDKHMKRYKGRSSLC